MAQRIAKIDSLSSPTSRDQVLRRKTIRESRIPQTSEYIGAYGNDGVEDDGLNFVHAIAFSTSVGGWIMILTEQATR